MKNISCAALLIFTGFTSFAQDTLQSEKKHHYFLTFYSGMLAGDQGRSITYTTSIVQGIILRERLRAGVGIGFDSYAQWQALPVFGNVHFDVHGTKNVTFIQVNYGWAHAWKQKTEGTPPTSARGGQIFNPMVGCRMAAGNLALYLAAGYKFQSTTTQYDYLFDSSFQNYYGSTQRIEQNLRHIVFTLGVGWR